MSFASPALLALLAIPVVAALAYAWMERRPTKYVVPFTNVSVLAGVATRSRGWRRHALAAVMLAAIALLCIGVARPKMTLAATSDRATVVLVLDVSGSMAARDVKPTRLDAARDAIKRFLVTLPGPVRVGVIAFSNTAEVIAAPTTDRDQVREALDSLLPQYGTALGDAVARAAELVHDATAESDGSVPETKEGEPRPGAIVFLSDGAQTQGLLSPAQGAAAASRLQVPVYTVALGTDDGVIEITRFNETRTIPVPPDRETLGQIAEATGGEAFDVQDDAKLRAVYENLGKRLGREDKPQEVTVAFVALGAALLAAASALGVLWAPRLP